MFLQGESKINYIMVCKVNLNITKIAYIKVSFIFIKLLQGKHNLNIKNMLNLLFCHLVIIQYAKRMFNRPTF